LVNRLAEEWYRQFLSWKYRRKGEIVVYDRHFSFDFERDRVGAGKRDRWSDSLHRWILDRFYPKPDLVLYLDAPAEVLFARKGEATLEYLEERRTAFTHMARTLPNVIQIDATQPLERVYDQVEKGILDFGARAGDG
jgi:thymidylate kinase